MKSQYTLAIIGAGPAGMAAAIQAAQLGIDVVVFDQQANPGGQIYRSLEHSPLVDKSVLGEDYLKGADLITAFRALSVDYQSNASLWNIDRIDGGGFELGVLIDGNNHFIVADKLLLATGAQERPMPIPGWQLPGVMTAGAGQILLKSGAILPADGVVLAGSGPLLLLLVCQYLRVGVKIQALLDTTPAGAMLKALPFLPGALRAGRTLLKGVAMISTLHRERVPIYRHCSELAALGEGQLQQVTARSGGKQLNFATSTLLLHQGIIPGIHFPQLAGCKLDWSAQQLCWQTRSDCWGETTSDSTFIVGDGAGIVGARASQLQGEISALQIAHQLSAITESQRDQTARPLRRSLHSQLAIRPFLDAIYHPNHEFLNPTDSTMVCRCEEISAGEIRAAARLGCSGPNQAKAFTRCGMGPCQGRQCGSTVSEIIAEVQGVDVEQVGYYRTRPPLTPITLGQLAKSYTAVSNETSAGLIQ